MRNRFGSVARFGLVVQPGRKSLKGRPAGPPGHLVSVSTSEREPVAAVLRLTGMNCAHYREQLSARMDGEAVELPDAQLDAHLADCPACRGFADSAVAVNRRLRVQRVRELPDLSGPILAGLKRPAAVRRPRMATLLRVALAGVALAQLALGLAQLFGLSHMGMNMTAMSGTPGQDHLFNETTAWNIAVGIGLLVAAARPRLARGFLTPLAVFVAVLTLVSIGDILSRQVTVARLESHAFLVLGLVLLFLVDRAARKPAPIAGEITRPLAETGRPGADPVHLLPGPDRVSRLQHRTGGEHRGRHAA